METQGALETLPLVFGLEKTVKMEILERKETQEAQEGKGLTAQGQLLGNLALPHQIPGPEKREEQGSLALMWHRRLMPTRTLTLDKM